MVKHNNVSLAWWTLKRIKMYVNERQYAAKVYPAYLSGIKVVFPNVGIRILTFSRQKEALKCLSVNLTSYVLNSLTNNKGFQEDCSR